MQMQTKMKTEILGHEHAYTSSIVIAIVNLQQVVNISLIILKESLAIDENLLPSEYKYQPANILVRSMNH